MVVDMKNTYCDATALHYDHLGQLGYWDSLGAQEHLDDHDAMYFYIHDGKIMSIGSYDCQDILSTRRKVEYDTKHGMWVMCQEESDQTNKE